LEGELKYWVLLDFETASATDLKKAGGWKYSECPTTEILCLAHRPQFGSANLWHPGEDKTSLIKMALDDRAILIAFNAAFEKAIWRNIMVPDYGFPDIPNERWHDVQAVAAMKVIPQAMGGAAQVLGLKEQKTDFDIKKLSRPSKARKTLGEYDRSPATLAEVDKYCLQDVATEVEMHKRLGWLPAGERLVWLLNQKVNERGIRIDLPYVRNAKRIVADASAVLLAEFRALTGLAPTQGAKFKDWLLDHGVLIASLDKEHIADILGTVAIGDEDARQYEDENLITAGVAMPADVRRVLSIRQLVGSSSISKLARMEQCVCEDGRARGLLQYHGTGPGRSAGRLLQPHNFPRPTLKENDEIIPVERIVAAIMSGNNRVVEETVGPAIETVVGGLRHALVPEKENAFISGDYSGIQARLVLALAGQHDKMALMASGADVYCDMAAAIFKRPIDKKKDPLERQVGKNSVLGLGFQMGAPKFQFKYAQDQTAEFCANVVQTYRQEWAPKVPDLWYGLQNAARRAAWGEGPQEAYGVIYALEGGWLSARLPSGRKMWYWNPRKVMRPMPWDADDIRPAWTYQAMKSGQWKTIDAFGGQLTENVIMGMERDIMTHAMLKCEAEGLPVVLEVHDEILVEPRAGQADEKMLKQIMLDVEPWVREIKAPIGIDTWTGDRYRK
jgi:DNA polymerase